MTFTVVCTFLLKARSRLAQKSCVTHCSFVDELTKFTTRGRDEVMAYEMRIVKGESKNDFPC